MQSPHFSERVLTELDHARLSKLHTPQLPEDWADELQAVDLVTSQDVAPDVVTMNSEVELVLAGQTEPQRLTLCYPRDAQVGAGRISVLSPIGAALLGYVADLRGIEYVYGLCSFLPLFGLLAVFLPSTGKR